MRTVMLGRDFNTLPISSSNEKLRAWMVALLVSKKIFCLSSIFSWVTTMCSYFFGQPSLSGGPGSLGHLSAASSTPSLSLSGSGQPSASSNPSLSSGSVGHLSTLSGMPSPSVSSGLGGLGGGLHLSRGDSASAALAFSSATATSWRAGKNLPSSSSVLANS